MLTRIIGLIALLVYINPAYTQITGIIIDGESSEPAVGAHVVSGNDSTTTDKNGEFLLKNNAIQIIISHIGYQTVTLSGKDIKDTVFVVLKPSEQVIEQINIQGNLNRHPLMKMPSNIGYIPNAKISILSDISFLESLNAVPGIFIHKGTLNTNRITIRGIGSRTPYGTNRIKAYYNGIPLTSGDGSTEIEDLNAINIGSIEVLKGSKSALYGSGLGGVININKPEYNEGANVFVKASVASYQTVKADLGVQFKQNGFYIQSNISKAKTEGWRQNSQYNRINFMLNSGFSNKKNQIDLLFLITKTKAYIPSSINERMFKNSPDSAAQNWLNVKGHETYNKLITGISYQYSFSKKISNKTSLFVQLYNGYESRPFNILDDYSKILGFRNISAWSFKGVKIQAGIESMFESYNWDIFETRGGGQGPVEARFTEKRQPVSVFLNGQWRFRDLIIAEVGVSLNTLKYALEDKHEDSSNLSGEYKYDPVYSPFFGLNLNVNKLFRIYSSISNGFSAPSVEETLRPEGTINTQLKPETGLNTEAGIRFKSRGQRIFADACIYNIRTSNLLVTKRESEEIFYGENAGRTWHRGLEIQSAIRLNKEVSLFPLTFNANYSFIKATFTNYIDDGIDFTGNVLPGIPKQNVFMFAEIESPWGLSISPIYQYTGGQYMDDSNEHTVNSFHIFHLKTEYSKKIKKISINIMFGINNILNTDYAAMILVNAPTFGNTLPRFYYPGMPRNYSFSIHLNY